MPVQESNAMCSANDSDLICSFLTVYFDRECKAVVVGECESSLSVPVAYAFRKRFIMPDEEGSSLICVVFRENELRRAESVLSLSINRELVVRCEPTLDVIVSN